MSVVQEHAGEGRPEDCSGAEIMTDFSDKSDQLRSSAYGTTVQQEPIDQKPRKQPHERIDGPTGPHNGVVVTSRRDTCGHL